MDSGGKGMGRRMMGYVFMEARGISVYILLTLTSPPLLLIG